LAIAAIVALIGVGGGLGPERPLGILGLDQRDLDRRRIADARDL
jgi:hypothetical protein